MKIIDLSKPMTGKAARRGLRYRVTWHNGTKTWVRMDRVIRKQGYLWLY